MPLDTRSTGPSGHAAPRTAARTLSTTLWLAASLLLLLPACAFRPAAPPPAPTATAAVPAPAAETVAATTVTATVTTATTPVPATPPPPPPAPSPLEALLATVERQRNLGPAELYGELARLGDAGATPAQQIQLALLLLQTHQPVDTARSLGLLQRVAASDSAEATGLRPLARLLASRVQDLRRLEDQQERQSQQLRDAQRRIELLNERLEAMREIERSLGPRPPANGRPVP